MQVQPPSRAEVRFVSQQIRGRPGRDPALLPRAFMERSLVGAGCMLGSWRWDCWERELERGGEERNSREGWSLGWSGEKARGSGKGRSRRQTGLESAGQEGEEMGQSWSW